MLTNIKSKKTKTFLLFILAILSVICIPKIIKKVTIKKYTYKIIPKEIKGQLITLKKLKSEYFYDYHKMSESPLIKKVLVFPKNRTFEWTKNFLQKELKNESMGKIFLYTIFDNTDNKLIGSIEIREKNETDPGQLGCWLNENYWGSGKFKEALDLISKTYFELKKEPSYTAHVETWNLRSFYALKKGGFKFIKLYYQNGKSTRYILELFNPNKA